MRSATAVLNAVNILLAFALVLEISSVGGHTPYMKPAITTNIVVVYSWTGKYNISASSLTERVHDKIMG